MSDFRLKVFHAVATHLSFTKASNELFITQPAVSKNIQELENLFDIRLFERKGNKIELTQAGQILLSHTEQILYIYNKIDFDLSILKNTYAGQIQLGASTTIGQYVLPKVLAKFYQSFPDIKLSLLNDNTEKIEQALIEHKIELGIVEGKTHNSDLKYHPFMQDEIVAVACTQQKVALKDEISLQELAQIPIVCRERGSGTLEIIENKLAQHKIKLSDLSVAMYLGSTESIKNFLRHSNCIGFLSIQAIAKELIQGEFKVLEIPNLTIDRTFYFVHLQGKASGLAETFIKFTIQQYNKKL
ncbi:LysR family transcriptional regulator [Flectobacillus major]|uniref:LysR family transcriptional regulator n=1 Tax=Flectobacillus major TaxID=103 RepID=UPI000410F74E|nr:LysR family transcriptional regulator [Flectobacillus major]